MKIPRLHAHRVAAIHPIDFVADGGQGLGRSDPVKDLLMHLGIIDITDDAVGTYPSLTQGAIGRQKAHIAWEGAIVVRKAEDGHIAPDRVDERPSEEGEIPNVIAHDDHAAACSAQLLAHLLGHPHRGDDLRADDDLWRGAIHILEALTNDLGPLLHHGHILGVVLLPDVRALIIQHRDADGSSTHGFSPLLKIIMRIPLQAISILRGAKQVVNRWWAPSVCPCKYSPPAIP